MPRRNLHARGEWLHRLDRFAADLNVLLVMFAIGLGVLDLTLLFGHRVIEPLPATHAVYADTQSGTGSPAGN
jgi:hypothetical protein